jgi:hypothetical protein
MIQGRCFCGFVRYQADGPFTNETICHCTMCRGTAGAPFVAWATVPRASFRIVAGDPTTFRSSDRATRAFCPRCGTQLTFADDQHLDEIDVTICSLERPEDVFPKDHTWARSRLPWISLSDQLPEYPKSRTAP